MVSGVASNVMQTLPKTQERARTNEVETTKEVSKSRFEQIKEQVENGTYQVDLRKTAEKMALHLLG